MGMKWFVMLLVLVCAACADAQPMDAAQVERLGALLDAGRHEQALVLAEEIAEASPRNHLAHYNLACAQAVNGAVQDAMDTLVKAIGLGFVDFDHMERDAHLAALHDQAMYQAIVQGWAELLDQRGAADLASLERALDAKAYTFEQDVDARLHIASAFDPRGLDAAKREMRRVEDWSRAHLPMLFRFPEGRPPAWVTVILPTTRDFVRLIGVPNVGGYYDKDNKRLVTRDVGPSLRHEYFHVLHWRHMMRIGQVHPIWVQEGLASMFEDMDGDSFAPSWRTNMVKRMQRRGGIVDLDALVQMPRKRFMGSRRQAHYAEARALMVYLADRGVLRDWYAKYVDGFETDPTGAGALCAALGAHDLAEAQRGFEAWLEVLPEVSEVGDPRGASFGVTMDPGKGDGPVVGQIVAGHAPRPSSGERLRNRDVVLAVEGVPTPTLDDLYRVLGEHEPDAEVEVLVRRGSREIAVRVVLVAPE